MGGPIKTLYEVLLVIRDRPREAVDIHEKPAHVLGWVSPIHGERRVEVRQQCLARLTRAHSARRRGPGRSQEKSRRQRVGPALRWERSSSRNERAARSHVIRSTSPRAGGLLSR